VTVVTDKSGNWDSFFRIIYREETMQKRGYKELFVWRESVAFVPDVYAVIHKFPPHERFALADQMRRSAISIPANIAEGQAKQYPKEFLRHLRIAKGSLAELHTLFIIAEQVGYIDPDLLEELEQKVAAISRPIHRLMASLHDRLKEPNPSMDVPPESPGA
jgi:four helix bundle protein